MYLFQLSVTDKLSDAIVLSVVYCSLTPLMPSAGRPEESQGIVGAMAEKKAQLDVSPSSDSADDWTLL